MEKSWENFWTTGKVEDYLTYRNRASYEENKEQEKARKEERDQDTSWRGLK